MFNFWLSGVHSDVVSSLIAIESAGVSSLEASGFDLLAARGGREHWTPSLVCFSNIAD